MTPNKGSASPLRFTDHDQPIEFDAGSGVEEYTPVGGFDASAYQLSGALREQNVDIAGVVSATISHDDLRARVWDGATVTFYGVDWKYPMAGAMITKPFVMGRARFDNGFWTGELSGPSVQLRQKSGRNFARPCNADLFDSRCGLTASLDTDWEVQSVRVLASSQDADEPRRIFEAVTSDLPSTSDDFYKYGELHWQGGTENGDVGHKSIVKSYTLLDGRIELFEDTPFAIADNDRFTLFVGCDKLFSTCRDKFDHLADGDGNRFNFRAHHRMPGSDKLFKLPGADS